MRYLRLLLLSCCLAPLAAQTPPAANLLINGAFEQPGVQHLGLSRGSTYITGWTVTRDTIDYQSTYFTCPEGRFCLDLDGNPGAGAISQAFATTAGASYKLSFVWAGNPDCAPTVKRMRVSAAGQQSDFSFDTTGRSRSNMGWTTGTWNFTASAATTTLEIQSLDPATGLCGPMLDDVRVSLAEVTPCSYSIAPATAQISATGGSGSVAVTTTSGCAWTATSSVNWITITSGAAGSGNGTVAYSVAPNTVSASRTGTLTIAGQTFTLTQSGPVVNLLVNGGFEQPAAERLGLIRGSTYITGWTVTRDTIDYQSTYFTCPEGRFCLDLDGNPGAGAISQSFATTAGAPYTLSFIAAGNPDCAPTVKRMRVSAAGQQSDFSFDTTGRSRSNMGWATITWNFTASAATTTLEIQSLDPATGLCGTMLDDVRVNGSSVVPPCSFTIAPTSAQMTAAGGTGSVVVTTTAGCAWTAATNVTWITITSGASGSGNGTVAYSIAANSAAASRTGTLTIAGQTFTVTQAGACSYTINPTAASLPAAGGPTTVQVTTAAGCPWTAASAAAWLTVTSGASGSGSGPVTLTAAANTGAARSGTAAIAGQTFTANQAAAAAPPPSSVVIAEGGVVNAADFTPNLAPGELFTLFGTALAPASRLADKLPLPRTLEGVIVEVTDGTTVTSAPLVFVSANQINAQLPALIRSEAVSLRVRNAAGISNTVSVPILSRAPRLFTVAMDGKGPAIVVHADYRLVSASAPAVPGEVVLIYLTGLGAVTPAIKEGDPGGDGGLLGPLNQVTESVTVEVNGVPASVLYAGLAPGFPGLYQINAQMPTILAGGALPLIVKTATATSQSNVTLATSPAAWTTVNRTSVGPSGGRISGAGLQITVPPGAFTSVQTIETRTAEECALAGASRIGLVYSLRGLPRVTNSPITLEIDAQGVSLPPGRIFLAYRETGDTRGVSYFEATVDGSRAVVVLPPRAAEDVSPRANESSLVDPEPFVYLFRGDQTYSSDGIRLIWEFSPTSSDRQTVQTNLKDGFAYVRNLITSSLGPAEAQKLFARPITAFLVKDLADQFSDVEPSAWEKGGVTIYLQGSANSSGLEEVAQDYRSLFVYLAVRAFAGLPANAASFWFEEAVAMNIRCRWHRQTLGLVPPRVPTAELRRMAFFTRIAPHGMNYTGPPGRNAEAVMHGWGASVFLDTWNASDSPRVLIRALIETAKGRSPWSILQNPAPASLSDHWLALDASLDPRIWASVIEVGSDHNPRVRLESKSGTRHSLDWRSAPNLAATFVKIDLVIDAESVAAGRSLSLRVIGSDAAQLSLSRRSENSGSGELAAAERLVGPAAALRLPLSQLKAGTHTLYVSILNSRATAPFTATDNLTIGFDFSDSSLPPEIRNMTIARAQVYSFVVCSIVTTPGSGCVVPATYWNFRVSNYSKDSNSAKEFQEDLKWNGNTLTGGLKYTHVRVENPIDIVDSFTVKFDDSRPVIESATFSQAAESRDPTSPLYIKWEFTYRIANVPYVKEQTAGSPLYRFRVYRQTHTLQDYLLQLSGSHWTNVTDRRFIGPDWNKEEPQWIEFTLAPNKEALPWP